MHTEQSHYEKKDLLFKLNPKFVIENEKENWGK